MIKVRISRRDCPKLGQSLNPMMASSEESREKAHGSDAEGCRVARKPGAACGGFPLSPQEDRGACTLVADSWPLGLRVTD